ncbi:MAG: IS701 family transposase, partial [Candidatus Freyarchaeota archaeon]
LRTGLSWYEAKTSIIREAVRTYLANPAYTLNPTA